MLKSSWMSSLVVLLWGCGSAEPPHPPVYTTSGTVTYQGDPVSNASVTFMSATEASRGSFGTTNANGEFKLTTFNSNDGAFAGPQKVTVSKTVTQAMPASMDSSAAGIAREKAAKEGKKADDSEIPEKYSNAKTSKLTFTVDPNTKNHYEIKLED